MNVFTGILLIIYATISTGALLLMRTGMANGSFHFEIWPHLSLTLNYLLIAGILLYMVSFITWLIIIRLAPLATAYPISVGLVQLFLLVVSARLHHRIPSVAIIGSVLVIAGITFLTMAAN